MRDWKLAAAIFAILVIPGCGSNTPKIAVTVTPSTATVEPNGSEQFTATVTGTSTQTVTWEVCTASPTANPTPTCNSSALGAVTSTGLYTAPPVVPFPATIDVVATSVVDTNDFGVSVVTIDSGIRVKIIPATYSCTATSPIPPTSASMQTGESYALTACVTGTANTQVTWSVNSIAGGNTTLGFITPGGVYTAPSPTPGTVTITATSSQDQSKTGSFMISVGASAVPTLTTIDPITAAQGSLFQDVYLVGTEYFSTSSVLVNGSTDFVTTTLINATTIRARIAAPLLQTAGSLALSVESQCVPNCNSSPALNLTVSAVRPGLISSAPVSIPQNSTGAQTVGFTGGFYSPSTTVTFDGQSRPASLPNNANNPNDPYNPDPRLLDTVLSGTDFGTAGLFPLVIQNAGVTSGNSSIAALNLAITPTASSLPTGGPPNVVVGSTATPGPSAVAINTATATAVIANTTEGSISLINLNSLGSPAVTIPVGQSPTGVAVDNLLNVAIVPNNGTNQASVVNLSTQAVTTVCLTALVSGACPALPPPSPSTTPINPFSVGVNSLTHRALIANQSTNVATVVDLSTTPPTVYPQIGGSSNPVSTGLSPEVAIVQKLNWAIVTPGGTGTVSVVDLGGEGGRAPGVVATLTITPSVQGIGFDPETNEAILTDPGSTSITLFNALDNSVATITYDKSQVASAVNPLTNIGVTLNNQSDQLSVFDLGTQLFLGTVTVGPNPVAVAIDPTTDSAVVVNQGSNMVSVFSLGAVRALHITQLSPDSTLTSTNPLSLTVIGNGFETGAEVRLDGTAVPTTSVAASCSGGICRELVATVPASMLTSARRYVVDVQNPDLTVSNIRELPVIQPVSVGTSPVAVAIDTDRDLAIVTNSLSNDVTIVNLASGTAFPPISVGTGPNGVAVLPRLGLAVVANSSSNDFSIIDDVNQLIVAPSPIANCSNCNTPTGLAINADTATVIAVNNISNNLSLFSIEGLPTATPPAILSLSVDQAPLALAIDPVDNIVAVAAAPPPQDSGTNTVDIISLTTDQLLTRLTGSEDPTGVEYDPAENKFLIADSLNNNVVIVDPVSFIQTRLRVGINPTSLAYNFQTSSLVTINTASNTASVVDLLHQKVQVMLGISGSQQFSVAIDPKLNLAVVVDQNNDQVLLVPIPR
jgi:DNA-binding beta-propeller fold protein YncE